MSKFFDLDAYKAFAAKAHEMRAEKDLEANSALHNASPAEHRVAATIVDAVSQRIAAVMKEQLVAAENYPYLAKAPESSITSGLLDAAVQSLAMIIVYVSEMGKARDVADAVTEFIAAGLPQYVAEEMAFRRQLLFEEETQREALSEVMERLSAPGRQTPKPTLN